MTCIEKYIKDIDEAYDKGVTVFYQGKMGLIPITRELWDDNKHFLRIMYGMITNAVD